MEFRRVKISTTAPPEYCDAIRQAVGEAGAGHIGEYTFCSFSTPGKGRSMPSSTAQPFIGTANKLEIIDEEQIEVVCNRADAKKIIAALRKAHPYEEVIVDITPLIDEDQL